ncbi:MAG TPA: hypothetical protein VNC14_05855 [Lapillicoccus sp.]|nr:hypothetical protein [Lapillicoccus sp.]
MRRWAGALAGVALIGVMGACTGGGGISIPTNIPTTIPTSITLPTIPTQTVTTETRTQTDTVTVTTTATSRPSTRTVTETATPSPTTTVPAEPTSSTGLPLWVWLLLLILLIAVIVLVVWLVRRGQSRTDWDEKMAQARRNAQWFEDSLVQQVMARGSTAEAWRTWQAAQPRLLSLDEQLYDLSTTAPDEERAQQAGQLRSRVAGLVEAMGADTSTSPDANVDDLRARRAAVWRARTELRNLLDATAPDRAGPLPPQT